MNTHKGERFPGGCFHNEPIELRPRRRVSSWGEKLGASTELPHPCVPVCQGCRWVLFYPTSPNSCCPASRRCVVHPGAGRPFYFVLIKLFLPKKPGSFCRSPALLRDCPCAQPVQGPFLFRSHSKVTQHEEEKENREPGENPAVVLCVWWSDGQPLLTLIAHHIPEMSRAEGQSTEILESAWSA